jgi:hypothetical protein
MISSYVHIIKLPNPSSKIATLKIIISPLSKSESKSFMILFYGNPLNSVHVCIQMVVTIALINENVCMSRCWKDELVAYRIYKQPSPRITHLMPLKSDHSFVCPVCSGSV